MEHKEVDKRVCDGAGGGATEGGAIKIYSLSVIAVILKLGSH